MQVRKTTVLQNVQTQIHIITFNQHFYGIIDHRRAPFPNQTFVILMWFTESIAQILKFVIILSG